MYHVCVDDITKLDTHIYLSFLSKQCGLTKCYRFQYACRKTLADGRQRIRGRFARNDEILEASLFQRREDKNNLWVIIL